jgi:transcriptional regulator with XRE-family HTH domain
MENDSWKGWGARFKAHMRTAKVTQERLAEKMEVTQGAIAHWLSGRRDINLADYFRLCTYADADPQKILFSTTAITSVAVAEALRTLATHVPELRALSGAARSDREVEQILPPVPSNVPPHVRKRRRYPASRTMRKRKVT